MRKTGRHEEALTERDAADASKELDGMRKNGSRNPVTRTVVALLSLGDSF
jgi:hypothetical protein